MNRAAAIHILAVCVYAIQARGLAQIVQIFIRNKPGKITGYLAVCSIFKANASSVKDFYQRWMIKLLLNYKKSNRESAVGTKNTEREREREIVLRGKIFL